MKKLVVLLVVLVGLGGSAMAQNVAHVDSKVLWDTLPSAKDALAEYQQIEAGALTSIQDLQKEFEANYMEYQANKANMLPTVREYQEKKLMGDEEHLQQQSQELQDFLMKTRDQLNAPLQDRIIRAINTVSEKLKLAYVFDKTTAIYSAGGRDITNEVVAELLRLDKAEAVTPL